MNTCPHCNGHGENRGFISSMRGHYIGAIQCRTCQGSGEISDEALRRIQVAEKLCQDRRAPYDLT